MPYSLNQTAVEDAGSLVLQCLIGFLVSTKTEK